MLSGEEEARYGYLAAVNSTTLSRRRRARPRRRLDAAHARARTARRATTRSWPLGRRAHDRALPARRRAAPRASRSRRCASTSRAELAGRAVARPTAGGSPASAARCATSPPRRSSPPALPSYGVQGFRITRDALGELIERFARADRRPSAATVAGHQGRARRPDPGRRAGDRHRDGGRRLRRLEATEAGLREGVFFETLLGGPAALRATSAATTVRNLAAQYDTDFAHTEPRRAAGAGDVGRARRRRACTRGDPEERELLWAAAMLHDIGDGGRLRRPPQALALPDPQRRPAGLHAARGGADRPGARATTARARRRWASSRRSPRDGDAELLDRIAAVLRARRAARALARPGRARHATSTSTTATSSCACTPTRTSRSPAGRPSVRASCSSARSAATLSVS